MRILWKVNNCRLHHSTHVFPHIVALYTHSLPLSQSTVHSFNGVYLLYIILQQSPLSDQDDIYRYSSFSVPLHENAVASSSPASSPPFSHPFLFIYLFFTISIINHHPYYFPDSLTSLLTSLMNQPLSIRLLHTYTHTSSTPFPLSCTPTHTSSTPLPLSSSPRRTLWKSPSPHLNQDHPHCPGASCVGAVLTVSISVVLWPAEVNQFLSKAGALVSVPTLTTCLPPSPLPLSLYIFFVTSPLLVSSRY